MRLNLIPSILLALSTVLWLPASSNAQIGVPSGPVVFCQTQLPTAPDSYRVSVDGGAQTPQAMEATKDTRCPAAATHSYLVPASHFTVGKHTVQLFTVNAFGVTAGSILEVTIGVGPGAANTIAVLPPRPGDADEDEERE